MDLQLPSAGVGLFGNGSRIGGVDTDLESFTDMPCLTIQARPGPYHF